MKTIRIIICFVLSLFLVNCSKDKEIENPEKLLGEEVRFCAEIHNIDIEVEQTRATTAFNNKSFHLIV